MKIILIDDGKEIFNQISGFLGSIFLNNSLNFATEKLKNKKHEMFFVDRRKNNIKMPPDYKVFVANYKKHRLTSRNT